MPPSGELKLDMPRGGKGQDVIVSEKIFTVRCRSIDKSLKHSACEGSFEKSFSTCAEY